MTSIIKELVSVIADYQIAGKTPWLTIHEDRVAGVYPNRDIARSAKTGKPVKFEGQGFELLNGAVLDNATEGLETVEGIEDPKPGYEHVAAEAPVSEFRADLEELPAELPVVITPVPPVVEAAPKAADKPLIHKSEPLRPTKLVWQIADDMKEANPTVSRKEVLEECERRGIAFYTARTQYQVWKSMQA